jgi:N-acetylglucosaminyldiphosphoundecaprenol N-acetyl-beta-D-mannosaminyltransferase
MRTSFLRVPLDLLSFAEVEAIACHAIDSRRPVAHCSLNALKVVEARKDKEIKELLSHFDLITPDGMSIVWGLRLLGKGRVEQVAGVELMHRLLKLGASSRWRIFLLGAEAEVAAAAGRRVEASFPGVRIVGVQHGYFALSEEPRVADEIRRSQADLLFVGMPSPRKEQFLFRYRETMNVPFAMGVGGGLDILAGKTRRAPIWMQRSGLEWSYRVLQEPRRLAGRYLVTNLRFAGLLVGELLMGRRSRSAMQC